MSDTPSAFEPLFPLHRIVEAILFASQKPLSAKELSTMFKGAADAAKDNPAIACFAKVGVAQIREAIYHLERDYEATARSFEVRESAAGWQLVTRADFAPWLRQIFPENRHARLSAPAMETLAIIAYRQPITRADLEAVRGVAVDGVMQTLLDRGLVRIAGRADISGRPLLYETTQFFMEHFGLKNLDELPNASELRRVAQPPAASPAEPTPSPAAAPTTTDPISVP
jgi:segregation and condensation protein B